SPRSAPTPAGPQLTLRKTVRGAPTHQGGCPLRQRSNRTLIALAIAATAALVVAAVAMAATIVGTPGPDKLTGTPAGDSIKSLAGNDRVRALGGNDTVELG